tara:strand:+ start:1000 stop:1377 length:378 start_codon:yes stop_codon:yes gene_type:complete
MSFNLSNFSLLEEEEEEEEEFATINALLSFPSALMRVPLLKHARRVDAKEVLRWRCRRTPSSSSLSFSKKEEIFDPPRVGVAPTLTLLVDLLVSRLKDETKASLARAFVVVAHDKPLIFYASAFA